ncbi:MAG TPA: hypothetical protein VD927_04215 [Chryseosolibacter sp.]|nr:hypothetical protein [Chryseosolibacter sp.]
MKKTITITCLILATFQLSTAQNTMIGGNPAKGIDMNTAPFGIVSAFGTAEKVTTGSKYLYDNWKIGTIQLQQGEIKNCPVNIDLKNHVIEMNTDNGVRVLAVSRIERLVVGLPNIDQQVFENAKKYNGAQAQIAGLVEVLVNNETTLLKYNYSFVREGDYNAALAMGNNETKHVLKSKYFLHKEGKLVEIPTSRKKFIKNFPDASQKKIQNFFDETRLNLKKQDDLIAVCEFINDKKLTF